MKEKFGKVFHVLKSGKKQSEWTRKNDCVGNIIHLDCSICVCNHNNNDKGSEIKKEAKQTVQLFLRQSSELTKRWPCIKLCPRGV